MTNDRTMTLAIGTRVRLIKPVDNYPTILAEPGLTGTLAGIDTDGGYWVKLDRHFDELDEWQNQLRIWDWSTDEANADRDDLHPETFLEAIADDDKADAK
jgi:hypothetical protein